MPRRAEARHETRGEGGEEKAKEKRRTGPDRLISMVRPYKSIHSPFSLYSAGKLWTALDVDSSRWRLFKGVAGLRDEQALEILRLRATFSAASSGVLFV